MSRQFRVMLILKGFSDQTKGSEKFSVLVNIIQLVSK